MKNQQPHPRLQLTAPIELRVVITNGDPVYDTKLRFEFTKTEDQAQVWLARLPRLKNYDAFPRQLAENRWELRLDAEGETHPMEIHAYPPENAGQWLKRVFHYENRGSGPGLARPLAPLEKLRCLSPAASGKPLGASARRRR